MCDCNDAYIIVKGTINLKTVANNGMPKKHVALKNNAPFPTCITKSNRILIENARCMTSRCLWNCYRDKIGDEYNDDDASEGKSFRYKRKIM